MIVFPTPGNISDHTLRLCEKERKKGEISKSGSAYLALKFFSWFSKEKKINISEADRQKRVQDKNLMKSERKIKGEN